MNTAEDRILAGMEKRPRLSKIEVSAKAAANVDNIIRVIAETDPVERPALMLKLYKMVSMATYLKVMTHYYGTRPE